MIFNCYSYLTGRPRLVISSKNFDNHFHLTRDSSHSQIESITESTAHIIESALEAVNMLIDKVELKNLSGEQKVQLKNWHDGLKQASTVIRRPT